MSSCTVVSADFALYLGIGQRPVIQNVSLVISPSRRLRELTIPLPEGYDNIYPGDSIKEWSVRQNGDGDVCDLTLRRFVKPGKQRTVNCGIIFTGEFGQRRSMFVYRPPSQTTIVSLQVLFLARHQPRLACGVLWEGKEPGRDAVVAAHQLNLEQQEPDDSDQVFWSAGFSAQGLSADYLLGIVW